MDNVTISFLDQVLTPKQVQELQDSSLGLDENNCGEVWYNDLKLDVTPQTTFEQFITMYAKAYAKNKAIELHEEFNKSLKNVESVFENHFKLHNHKVFS